jgi:hypothetical protein
VSRFYPRQVVCECATCSGEMSLTSLVHPKQASQRGSRTGVRLALFVGGWRQEIGAAVTQRNVELLIGKLLTDEEFRDLFLVDGERALRSLIDRGFHLTQSEIAALRAIDASLWPRVASEIDPRLRKARMRLPDEP